MVPRPRGIARLLTVVAVAATILVFGEPAMAVTVPETLVERRPVQAGPVEPGFPIDFVGVIWDVPADELEHGHAHRADDDSAGARSHGAVRFRTDGVWSGWTALIPDGAQAEGQWASGLVPGDDADAYQVRGIPAHAGGPRAVAINTTDGKRVQVGEVHGNTAGALASSQCMSRADWGADESLRFTKQGRNRTETWPPEFYDTQTLTVHHTATPNGDGDPAARVRSIYQYHAVERGWGDIGYQYLVDDAGVVYEGRWSGTTSRSCRSNGGDGSDFAHENTDLDGDAAIDEMVTGAHVGGANSGNTGIALLGDFTVGTGQEPTAAAVGSLEDVLTELSRRHGVDPTGTVQYVNPVNGSTRTVAAIPAHRDWEATACPGDHLYAQLPTIRENVKARVGSTDPSDDPEPDPDPEPPPPLSVTHADPATIGVGTHTVTVTGTGFVEGAAVSLQNGKGHTPTVNATTFISDTRVDASITVENKGPSSAWDVRVTLPSGATATCLGCLTVKR